MAKPTTAKKDRKEKKEKSQASAVDRQRFPKIVRRREQLTKGPHGGMRLLLIEDVPHLGKQGDIVEVKPGYGRNYLVPYGLATDVTPETLARIEKHKANIEAVRIARLNDLKMLAKKLEKHSLTIEANANEENHLYGSVTAVDIAKALHKDELPIDEAAIRLEGPIKELGLYNVKVHLADEVETELKVWVVPTGGKPAATE
jgi:large subunit ribosomal protein L9